jgi:hypothetical protein
MPSQITLTRSIMCSTGAMRGFTETLLRLRSYLLVVPTYP